MYLSIFNIQVHAFTKGMDTLWQILLEKNPTIVRISHNWNLKTLIVRGQITGGRSSPKTSKDNAIIYSI